MAKRGRVAQPQGGLGALSTDVLDGTTHRASDLNMVRRAVREWEIPLKKRPAVVARLLRNVADGDASESTKAAAVLVGMTKMNQADVHHVERVAAGIDRPTTNDVRILIVDARTGVERPAADLGDFYDQTVIDGPAAAPALPLPARDPPRPRAKQGRKGGAKRG